MGAALRSPLAWSLALHVVSRALFYYAGVRFDASWLPDLWQFVDPELLRQDLARSLFYLHSQPPLFNAFLGVVLKLTPVSAEQAVFWGCFLSLGIVLHVALYALVRGIGAGPISAAAAALLFSISPAVICYENWLFYSYPVAVGLTAAAALVHRYVAQRGVAAGLLAFSLVAAVALTHAFFHLAWCLAVLGIVLAAVPRAGRRRSLAVATPLLLVLALYAKNAVVFGQFAASYSWMAMNLASVTLDNAPDAERASLVRDGTLSPVAKVPPFSPLEDYPRELPPTPRSGVPVLDLRTKLSGTSNFHNLAYLEISRRYLRDAIVFVRLRPELYLRNVANGFGIFTLPATQYLFLGPNRVRLSSWDRLWRIFPGGSLAALRGVPPRALDVSNLRQLAESAQWLWMALLLFALVGSALEGVRGLRAPRSRPRAALLLFVALCLAYVTLPGNLVELGENNRFRFVIDPLIWAAAWGLLDAAVRRLRGDMLRAT
jgi:hypothetical protein